MKQNLYPVSKPIKTSRYERHKLGIYRCKVETKSMTCKYPCLGVTYEGKLIFPEGSFEGVFTSVEIEYARENGYSVETEEGYYFEDSVKLFSCFVDRFSKEKEEAGRDGREAWRYVVKIFMNSLYGKFAQRRERENIEVMPEGYEFSIEEMKGKNASEIEKGIIRKDEVSKSTYIVPHISSFVTSYARVLLHQNIEKIIEEGYEVHYCDTDSIICDMPIEIAKEKLGIDNEKLGELSCEIEGIKEGIFLLPKLYALKLNNGREIVKSKGFSKGLTFEMLKKQKEGSFCIIEYKEVLYGWKEAQKRFGVFQKQGYRKKSIKSGLTKRKIVGNTVQTYSIMLK